MITLLSYTIRLVLGLVFTTRLAVAVHADGNFALSFDGVDEYVSVQNLSDLNAYPLTVSAWIKTTQTNNYVGLVNKYVSGSENGWQIYLLGGNVRAFYFQSSTRYVWDGADGLNGGSVANGAWHHVAFTVDATGGHLYVDGVLKDSRAWTGTPGACTTTQPMSIGLYPGGTNFSGTMDEVQLWGIAQPQSWIQTNLNRGLIGSESSLIAYYRFDEGTGTLTQDAAPASQNNEGVLMNGPTWVPGLILQPAVVTQPASLITSVSATLYGVANAENTNTSAWFQWGLTTNYGAVTAMQSVGNGPANTNITQALTGLAQNIAYHYQAVASNSLGTSFGGDQSFVATGTNMIYARAQHTATLLPNGKVLATGGRDQNFANLSTAEVYDPISGTWSLTSSMATARYQHTATLLPNGKVLVVGGQADFVGIFSSAEVYDPASGTWTPTGSMATNRYAHTATLLPSGKVLVAGGFSTSGPAAVPELYDPVAGTWSQTGPLVASRYSHTATLLPNGKVLVAGGKGTNFKAVASAELYDPAAQTWSATHPMSTNRYDHTATLLPNGKVIVAGGEDTNFFALASTEIYDPLSGLWTNTTAMINSHAGHTTTLLPNGKILVDEGDFSAEIYDPVATNWTQINEPDSFTYRTATLLPNGKVLLTGGILNSPVTGARLMEFSSGTWATNTGPGVVREFPTMTLLPNGKVLLAGGDDGFIYPTAAFLYNPVAGTWAGTGPITTGCENHTATLLTTGNVLVAGGNEGCRAFKIATLYNTAAGTWSSTGGMNTGRYSHTATLLLNGKVLVAGGYSFNNNAYLTSAELYDPVSGTWTNTGSLAGSRSSHTATLLPDGRVLVAGGTASSSSFATNTAEVYNLSNGTWTVTGPMSSARSGHIAILLPSGKVLVAGGVGPSDGSLASAELYDPALGTWTNTGMMTTSRANDTATLLANGKVLVAGGSGSSTRLASAELYDPVPGTWAATGSLNKARIFFAASFLPNGQVLAAVGDGSSGLLTNSEVYDTGLGFSNSWRPQVTTVPLPLNLGSSVAITGSQFRGISEGSGGTSQNSPADHPVVQLRSLENARTMFLPVTNWSTNSLACAPFTGFPTGYALATVFVNGIPSTGSVVDVAIPAATPFNLTGVRMLNGSFQFSFTNNDGASFTVLTTTNVTLPSASWSVLSGVTEVSPGQFQFSDLQTSNIPSRFYRIRSP